MSLKNIKNCVLDGDFLNFFYIEVCRSCESSCANAYLIREPLILGNFVYLDDLNDKKSKLTCYLPKSTRIKSIFF